MERKDITEDAHRQMSSGGCFLPMLVMAIILLLFNGCCTCKKVAVGSDKDSTALHYEWQIDTIREVDSVFVSVREKGDTVWIEKYKYKYRYKTRDVEVHDTTTVVEKVTVEVPVEVVKEVPRKKGWFEKTQQYGFWLLLALWGFKYRNRLIKSGMKFLE